MRTLQPKLLRGRNGRVIKVYSIGELSKASGYSISRIRGMAIEKILPQPTFVDKLRRRWYSDNYMETFKIAMFEREGRKIGLFKKTLTKVFTREGLIKNGKNIELGGLKWER